MLSPVRSKYAAYLLQEYPTSIVLITALLLIKDRGHVFFMIISSADLGHSWAIERLLSVWLCVGFAAFCPPPSNSTKDV